MWVICNKHSRTSGPCVTTMRWILNTRQIPGQLSVFTGQPPSLGNKNQVHLLSWAKDEWICSGRIAACKHCGTNATGTTTDTINTAVVPLTMSVAWHSGPVWICWKKRAVVLTRAVVRAEQSRSSGKSSEDMTGPTAGQGSTPCFKVVSQQTSWFSLIK